MGKKLLKGAYRVQSSVILSFMVFALGCTVSGGKSPDSPPPGGAVLSVHPTTIEFEIKDPASSSYESSFDVNNIGSGTMYWEIAEFCDFADCDPDSGWLVDDTAKVTVLLKDKQIQTSTSGMICINSTGGTSHITVTVDFFVHLSGRVVTRAGESYVAVPGAQVSFGAQYTETTISDSNGYYDYWARKEEVVDQNEFITSKATKAGYEDLPYTGRFDKSGNPPVYTHDFVMIPK
jgi:hypothetical protein